MKGPRCRLCEHEHWSWQGHVWPDEPKPAPVRKVAEVVRKVAPPVTEVKPVVRKMGRPPKYSSRAEQQAAYRQRKREA